MATQQQIFVPSGSLTVHSWAPGRRPRLRVLLAHGYAEHAGRYDYLASRLVAAGALVIAPDQRGHGTSPGERGLMVDLDDYAVDLAAIAKRLRGLQPGVPEVLIGHSMGGNIATRYVQLGLGRNLSALVLSGPVVGGNPAVFALGDLDPIPEAPVDPAVLSRVADVGAAFAADPLVYHGAYKRGTVRAYRTSVRRIAEGGTLGSVPTLWLHGEDDALGPLDLAESAISRIAGPNFHKIIYPGARHEIFNETNRDDVIDDVLAFVAATVSTKSEVAAW